ncbi:MAG: Cation efflux system protein CusB precursor [Syntrophorhabdus sp. PtaU1.Bin002]|nr:MAG: Cation efflux system protein CusB precursor [Syntrophorhabdus sp. PtaU1.Bin002]
MGKRIATICFVIVTVGTVFFFASCKGGHNAEKAASIENRVTETSHQSAKPEEPAQKQEETPTVEIPLEKQQLIGVRTVTASIQPVEKIVRTTGKIEYDERKLTTINTKVEGWIEKLYINFTGVYVKKGAPLADIYSPELWATQQEFINLVKWAKKTAGRGAGSEQVASSSQETGSPDLTAMLSKDAESLLEAARQRLKLWDISDAQIKKIEENEKPIRTLTVYSPVGGYVLQKYAIQGMKVMAGEKLFDVSDLSSVWVLADIYEYELPVIRVGDTARLHLSYFPGKELTSKIEFVSPTLSNETRTAQVRFSVPNTGGKLKPGMLTDVEMKINLGKRLVVPDEAVIDTGLRQIVYVDKGDGYFEPRAVTPGLRAGNLVEVLQGLKAGEKVASSANFLIDSEAKLKGVEARGSAPGAKQEGPPAPVGHKH